jgi:uncharacterized protein
MAQLLLSSKTVIQEEPPNLISIPALPTSVTAIVAVTERGPDEAVLVTSKEEWNAIFGGFTADAQDGPLFVDGFYAAGGQFLWTKRVFHYTDILDSGTNTGVRASTTFQTTGFAPTSGSVTGSNPAPFDLAPGDTIVASVDGNPNDTATFLATQASVTSALTETFALSDGQTLTFEVDNGPVQTVIFNTAEFVNIALATAAEVAAVINAEAVGVQATVAGGAVVITSDTFGTDSDLDTFGGTALAVLGFTGLSDTGTGNVGDINAVSFAEVKAVLEAALTSGAGVTVTQEVGGEITISSNTTGAASSIAVDATSTADDEMGFDNATHSGSNGAADDTLTVDGKDRGAYANALSISIEAPTNGDADSFNLVVLEGSIVRESFANLKIGTANAASPQYVETVINDPNNGSALIQVTDELSVAPANDNLPAITSQNLTGGDDGLTGLVDVDFIGDSTTETGLHGFDTKKGIRILCVPGRATAGVQNATLSYAEVTRNGSMFVVLDPPANLSATQMITYVETTASLLESSEFGAIYWPRVKILNPNATVFGNDENIVVAPSGIICGVYARTDASQEGGIYQPPAGIERGILTGVVGFETDDVLKEEVRDLVFPKRVNPLTTDDGLPRFIDGPLTLKSTGNFPTVAERRGVIHIEQSIVIGTAFARHSNNDATLRARFERTVRAFLTEQMRVGAFRSRNPATAFSVDVGPGLNTEAVIFAGKLIARIGLATQKPALFIIIRVSQDTRALEEEIAGAA